MQKLRVGFLVDDLLPSHQVNELIKFVDENQCFDNPVLITGYKEARQESRFRKIISKFKKKPVSFFNIVLKAILLRVISRVELKAAKKRYPGYSSNQKIKNVDDYKVVCVNGQWSRSGLFLEMTDEDISQIGACNLDCVIRCGSGILRGRILDVAKFGVISFHHGDNRTNRGGPSGFWEVLNGEPSSGFIIQKLNQELDGGEVLFRGNLKTTDLWLPNYAQLLAKSNTFS